MKNLRDTGGTGKLRSHWERQIFKVIKQQGELPVYHVQSVNNAKDIRILHRNHLLKCEQLPLDVFDEDEDLDKKQKGKKAKKEKKQVETETPVLPPPAPTQVVDVDDGDSEGEDIGIAVYEDIINDQPVEVLDPVDTAPEDESAVAPEEAETVLEETDMAEETVIEDNEPEAEVEEHEEEREPENTSSDTDEETPLRRTTRQIRGRKIMTFKEVGGAPSWEVVGNG